MLKRRNPRPSAGRKPMVKPKRYRGKMRVASMRQPTDLLADLDTAALAYGKSRQQLVEEVLSEWLEANEPKIRELAATHKPNKKDK